jgi:hypothetical protein
MSNPKLGEKMLCAGTAACTADIMTFPLDVRIEKLLSITSLFKVSIYGTGGKSSSTNFRWNVSKEFSDWFGPSFSKLDASI